MITEIERKELRELFQGYYASDILKILKNKKITKLLPRTPRTKMLDLSKYFRNIFL